MEDQYLDFEWLTRAILTIKNTELDNMNNAVMKQLPYTVVAACAMPITASKLGGTSNGDIKYIPRITKHPSDGDLPFTLKTIVPIV